MLQELKPFVRNHALSQTMMGEAGNISNCALEPAKSLERDVLRRTILELVKKGHVHYTDVEKKAVATCPRFATSNTVRRQFYRYLLPNGYVKRVSRGVYRITRRGERILEILS